MQAWNSIILNPLRNGFNTEIFIGHVLGGILSSAWSFYYEMLFTDVVNAFCFK